MSDHYIINDAVLDELIIASRPYLKNIFQFLDILDFRHPSSDISAVVIIVECLFDRVEDACITSGVITDTRHVLPVRPVGRHIIIYQHGFVPFSSVAPINAKMLCKEAGDILSGSVRGVAGMVEFTL